MTIDINELRRLTQAATPGPWKACRNHECYEGAYFEIDPEDEAEYAAKPFTHIHARTGAVAAAHDLFEFRREDAEFIAAANPAAIFELLGRIEAAEKERDWHAERCEDAMNECDALRAALQHETDCLEACKSEIEQLRTKIAEMEKQKPVAWTTKLALEYGASRLGFQVSGVNIWGENGVPLYALPGAQPAMSVPREAIEKMLTQLMDIAVSNGANSVSMPDEYVEVAAWLCGIPAQPAPSVPDGWKLVPIEPTQEMLDAGEDTFVSSLSGTPTSSPIAVYRAMLAAAPEAKA